MRSWVAGLLVTLLATVLLLGGAVGAGPWDGVYLYRDFVTVPDPVLGANTLGGDGAPRAVPLDAVVSLLSTVLPAGLVARLLLVAPLLLVGSGMTALLRRHGPVATAVGAGLAVVNPYVAERLLLGQAPSLLGYAMIPWLVLAVRADRPLVARMGLVLIAAAPAAVTPVGAVMAGVTVLVVSLTLGPRSTSADATRPVPHRMGEAIGLLAPVALLSLPWLLAALAHPTAGAVPDGADAFAVAADGPWGTVGSVVTLGGVWASGAWPESRMHPGVLAVQLVLVLGAAGAWWWLRRGGRQRPDGWGPGRRRFLDLAAAGYVTVVAGVLLLAGPLLPLWRELQQVPGLALARDTHRWLGWAALAVAVLLALGAARLTAPVRGEASQGRTARGAVTVGVVVGALALGTLTVPDVPGRLARDLRPVAMPAEWRTVVELVNDGSDGAVLLLPWQPFRQVDWVGPVQFLDPLPRALEAEALHSRTLVVHRDGKTWEVGGEGDTGLTGLGRGASLSADALRQRGIGQVVVWRGSPGESPAPGAGTTLVHEGRDWQVLRVDQSP
ncbi:MAG TPA: hypothetical protein VK045_07375 [Ornithinicoccus sp.]|nr:hypothetical protein [Ornithinicoccus sp.]